MGRMRLDVRLYLVCRHKNLKKAGMRSYFVRDTSLFFSADICGKRSGRYSSVQLIVSGTMMRQS